MLQKCRILSLIFATSFCYAQIDAQTRTEFFAQINGRNSGFFNKEEFKTVKGIESFEWADVNHAEKRRTDSFTVLIIRKNTVIFYSKNVGEVFNKKIVSSFQSLLLGDKILFIDIYATSFFSRRSTYLYPIECTIN